jgi:hypothetical protein
LLPDPVGNPTVLGLACDEPGERKGLALDSGPEAVNCSGDAPRKGVMNHASSDRRAFDYVYFPSSGLVSIVVMMESGQKRRSEQRRTRAGCARPAREEPAMMTEVIAILVSVGLVLVTIVSAALVWRTKQQAKQAATRARTEAVNYLREAQSDLKNDRCVTP